MQITFIRHGAYTIGEGCLNSRGIDQMTCSAMVLRDIADKQKGIKRKK